MNIYTRIKQLCEKQELTVEDIEEITKIPPNTIKKWDKESPEIEYFLRVTCSLGVSPYWLMSGQKLNKLKDDEEILILLYRYSDKRGKKTINNVAYQQMIESE